MRDTHPSNPQHSFPDAASVPDAASAPDAESLMSGSRRGVSRSCRQLEIFPLHPGTNPARPAGDPRRPDPSRHSTCPSRHSSWSWLSRFQTQQRQPSLHCYWSVAREAWSAVARKRARRRGVATVLEQGTATVMPLPDSLQDSLPVASPASAGVEAGSVGAGLQPVDGQDPDRMCLLEKVLATMGIPVGLLLLFSVL